MSRRQPLTGESVPVDKATASVAADLPLPDRVCMVYSGTLLTAGRARAVVVATGLRTELGHIATLTTSADETKTPLERRIEAFGRTVIWGAGGLFALILLLGWLQGLPMADTVLVAVS